MDLFRTLYSKSKAILRPSQPDPVDWTKLPDVHSLDKDDVYRESRQAWKDVVDQGLIRDSSKDAALNLSDLPAFQYEPLTDSSRCIRILCLERPRRVKGYLQPTIPCATLFEKPLDDDAMFIALSYCWGSPQKSRPIIVNESLIWVTESLGSALEHVQEEDRVILLWADALCINQEDDLEKSAQVQQMGSIYSAALFVLAWLGPAADESDLALKAMAHIGQVCIEMPDHLTIRRRYEFFSKAISGVEGKSGSAFPTTAIVALLNRAWWNRIWIVQEVVLASKVHVLCGRSSTDFFTIGLAFTALAELPLISAQYGNGLTPQIQSVIPVLNCQPKLIQAALSSGSKEEPFVTRIHMTPNMGATNPKDHIYGLLGMVSDVAELGIQVNYQKSCSELYTEITVALLQRQSHLQILSRCSSPKAQEHLPTWVPDWSIRPKPMIWNPKFDLFSAGKCNRKQDLEVQGNALRVHGAIFSPVTTLGTAWPEFSTEALKNPPKLVSECLTEITEFVSTHGDAYIPSKAEDTIWRLSTFDTEFALLGNEGRYNRRANADMRAAAAACQEGGPPGSSSLEPAKQRYRMATIANLVSRQLFSTRTGHVGIGPVGIEVGDLVCVLVEGSVPFVIRGMEEAGMQRGARTTFQLVGECYIQGIMDGEFMASGAPLQDIVLV